MNPTLDLSSIYRIFYNVQTVSVLNPDGMSWTNVEALREPTDTVMVDDNGNGTYSQRTTCTWVFFKTTVPDDLIPQLNTRITDSNGTAWYVSDVRNRYFGNVFTLKTESRAGVGVEDQQVPQAGTSTSTTSTTQTTPTCRPEGEGNADILLGQQLRFCSETRPNGWHSSNLQTVANQACVAEFVVDGPMSSLDFYVDASGVSNGQAVVYRNGVVYQPNFAGGTVAFNFANPTVGDVWRYYVINAQPLFYGATFIDIDAVAPVTTTSSTTGTGTSSSTSSSTTTQTTTVTTTTTPIPYVTQNLQFYVDAAVPASYPGSGATWYDLSPNGNHVTLVDPFGSMTWNPAGWFTNFNYNTSNRGYFRRATCQGSMPSGTGEATMSVWFRMPDLTQPHYDLLCYGGSVGAGCGTALWLALWPVGLRQAFWFYNCYDFGANTGVTPTMWCNVTGTKDASGGRKLYVNGVLLATDGPQTPTGISGQQISLFWDNFENQPKLNGDMSIAMVYDRQLTDAEVLQNYEAFKDRYSLWMHYDIGDPSTTFQDTAGTIPATANGDPVALVKDLSGNGWDIDQNLYGDNPLLVVPGQNGMNVLNFLGLNQGSYRANLVVSQQPYLPTAFTMFWVYTVAGAGPFNGGNSQLTNFYNGNYLVEQGTHGANYLLRNGAGAYDNDAFTNPALGGYGILVTDYDPVAGEGRAYGTSNTQLGTTLTVPPDVGGVKMNAQFNSNGDGSYFLAEFRLYTYVMDAGERLAVINELKTKWGI